MKIKAGGLGGLFFYKKANKSHTYNYNVHTFHNQIKTPRNSLRSSDISFNITCGIKSFSGTVSDAVKKIKAVYFPGYDLGPTIELDRIMTASRERLRRPYYHNSPKASTVLWQPRLQHSALGEEICLEPWQTVAPNSTKL